MARATVNILAVMAFAVLQVLTTTHACSDVLVNATEGVLSARTMDFDVDLQTVLEIIPRNTSFQELPVRECVECPDYAWQNKYGFVAFQMFGLNVAADGLNEKGLSAAWLYLENVTEFPVPDVAAATNTTDPKPIVASLPSYLLGNFATVDEVKEGLKHIQVAEIDDRIRLIEALFPPGTMLERLLLHVSVHDASGKSLVIEMLKGQVVALDNPNGVLTNEPEFTEQLRLLHQATSFSGSYSPIGRFQRLSILNSIVPEGFEMDPNVASFLQGPKTQQRVSVALHLINTVVDPISGGTEWTVVRDHAERVVYFQSYENPQLQRLALGDIDWANSSSRRAIPVADPARAWFVDLAADFQAAPAENTTLDLPPRTVLEAMIPTASTNATR